MAGLVSGYYLSNFFDVTIFEKESVIGGRTSVEKINSVCLDSSAQFLFGNYSTIFHLLSELGLSADLHRIKKLNFSFYRSGVHHPFSFSGMFRYTSLKQKFELLRLSRFLLTNSKKLKFTNILTTPELDDSSFSDWFKKNYSEALLENVAQPVVSSLSLSSPEHLSAAFGLSLLNATVFEPMFGFEGGIGAISNHLERVLVRRGVRIHKNAAVSRINFDGDSVRSLSVGGEDYQFDKIISTLPLPVLDDVAHFDAPSKKLIRSVSYAPAVHCWFLLNSSRLKKQALLLPRLEWPNHLALLESSIKSDSHLPRNASMLEAFIFDSAAASLLSKSDSTISDKLCSDLSTILDFDVRNHLLWSKVKKIKHAIPIHSKNYAATSYALENLSSQRNLFLAGDYMAMPSVETAAWSGFKTYEKVVALEENI